MDKDDILKHLENAKAELTMFYEITNAMRTTLKLEQILYIILTAVTSHEGLGFNRAMLFLINEETGLLEGVTGIGPDTAEEAHKIWTRIEHERMTLDDLIQAYDIAKEQPPSRLVNLIRSVRVPLNETAGILALTALEGVPFEITAPEARTSLKDTHLDILGVEFFVTVPLKAHDKVIGVILADNAITKKPILKDDVRILTMFANQAGLAIENSRLYERTIELANRDSLTGLWNHGFFQYILSLELTKAVKQSSPLSLVFLDIDNFKLYNDSLGHPHGDIVIKEIAHILRESARKTDFVARYGGEEFAIILPGVRKQAAVELAQRQRVAIGAFNFGHGSHGSHEGEARHLTISAGVSAFPEDGQTKNELIEKADKTLYKAKAEGKNRVYLA